MSTRFTRQQQGAQPRLILIKLAHLRYRTVRQLSSAVHASPWSNQAVPAPHQVS